MTDAQAREILSTHYGLTAHATSLGSQQDKNFMVTDDDGTAIGVLKIANPAFNAVELQAQDVAAELIADAEPNLRVAVPLPNTCRREVHHHHGFGRRNRVRAAAAVPARRHAVSSRAT